MRNKKKIYMLENYANNFVDDIEEKLYLSIKEKTDSVTFKLEKVLNAFSNANLNVQHFASPTGYGHVDLGRDTIDKIFADVLDAEKAAVRVQLVSGTHAIASSLFGVLRPGDNLLSITGRPYESLEEVTAIIVVTTEVYVDSEKVRCFPFSLEQQKLVNAGSTTCCVFVLYESTCCVFVLYECPCDVRFHR